MSANAQQVFDRLAEVSRQPRDIAPSYFNERGTTQATTTGESSTFAKLTAGTAIKLLSGRKNRFKVAVPAYEKLGPTDGTQNNDESFNLSHDLMDSPNTQSVVVWLDGSYVGPPKSVDYANDSITINDGGTNSTVHVWYIVDESATLEVVKRSPKGGASNRQNLYSENLKLVHAADQSDQPEHLTLDESRLQSWVPSDFTIEVNIKAPYEVRYEDPDGDGARATNMLLDLPALVGESEVPGLGALVRDDMSRA